VAAADARRHATLARLACLPAPWRISDFDFEAQPTVDKKLVLVRNPAENGHRFRRKADSVPELSGQRSGVTRTRFRLKADT
jgi:hypothetical protein